MGRGLILGGLICYNSGWKGGRVVEGTGLENQRRKRPQVRILSFPPHFSTYIEYGFESLMRILSFPPHLSTYIEYGFGAALLHNSLRFGSCALV